MAADDGVPPDLKAWLKASYDTIAPTYNAWTAQHNAIRLRYLDKLFGYLTPPPSSSSSSSSPSRKMHVLELGCGAGVPVTEELVRRRGCRVTANDLSSTQLALARAHLPAGEGVEVEWVQGDMMELDFAAGSLDAVVAMYSVIHLPRAEQAALLARIRRWLRPGTGVMLVNFAAEAVEAVVDEAWLGNQDGWMYWSGYGAEATLEKIREAGLEILVGEVMAEDGVDAAFLWVVARAPADEAD